MNTLWKIYFWLIAGLYMLVIIFVPFLIFNDATLFETKINIFSNGYDALVFLISLFGLVGFYGYVFRKKFLSQDIWKFIFLLILIETLGETVNILLERNYFTLVATIVFLPMMYGLYSYAFKAETSKVAANG
ncbi:hypothetical protein [Sulfurimonas sp. HSL3-7]|uniref:hypothetical protein n=1 Tax=Sulfonitrofixus jiaomeiensis TaxID=3131938 RepID=UPI0031F7A676